MPSEVLIVDSVAARQPHDPDVDEAVDRNQGVIELDVDSWKVCHVMWSSYLVVADIGV